MPEERKIELKTLHEKIGSTKLSFASAERLEKYLGVQQGCVSPLGILNDEVRNVTVIFDSVLLGEAQVGVHPNDNTATIWLSFENLYRLIREHGNEVEIVVF